ncbi:MAG: endo-1,4-beta-xylanase [Verrucomicrobia bacterium]|nr:endo-1,4-beta-xylanase [Verrucomicrobiota bacterium]MCH8513630.1 endo-1,4-beta-xylanase [Kiritimatiellia bacterium]
MKKTLTLMSALMSMNLSAEPADTPVPEVPAWRIEADRRIETHRKGEHRLRIVNADGSPLANAAVHLEQTGHDFKFGTCVSHGWLARDDEPAQKYREFIARHFNTVVGESSMKWAYTETERGKHDFTHADNLMAFATENGLSVRGHTLFWTKIRYKADWVKELEGEELKAAMENHLRQILPRYRGKLYAWDGINEMVTARFFEERIGEGIRSHIYKLAHELDPDTPLFTNEYSILCNDTGLNGYVELLDKLIEAGAPIGGIGIQEHAAERIADVPPEGGHMERESQYKLTPEGMWARMDRLAEYGRPIHLTEISFRAENEDKRAEAVDKFFRTAFAHPSVEVIMLWGFWQRAHWLGSPAVLFDSDFNPLPAGKALLNLLENEWKTRLELETDAEGFVHFHGFYGPYAVTVRDANGEKNALNLQHTREQTETVLQLH